MSTAYEKEKGWVQADRTQERQNEDKAIELASYGYSKCKCNDYVSERETETSNRGQNVEELGDQTI